jgi:drug/metabolite transporter (DMT)-like permease
MTANCRARQGLLLATAAGMLWGTVGIASKLLPEGVTLSPFHFGFARLAIAAPLLTLFSALVLGRALWATPTRVWPWVAAVGVLAACYQLCLFASLEQLGVARTALLTVCLPPVLIAGASALVSHLRPSAWTMGALLLALGGLSLVVGAGSNAHSSARSETHPLQGLHIPIEPSQLGSWKRQEPATALVGCNPRSLRCPNRRPLIPSWPCLASWSIW